MQGDLESAASVADTSLSQTGVSVIEGLEAKTTRARGSCARSPLDTPGLHWPISRLVRGLGVQGTRTFQRTE